MSDLDSNVKNFIDSAAIIPMETREQCLLKPLLEFFSHEANLKQFLDVVVLKERNIPLRVLDWFVTNYAMSHDVNYSIKRPNGQVELFCVYKNYKNQSKAHHKKYFDVYARGATITLEYADPEDDEKMINFETAICQLKFFKWAIENLILDYVEANYEAIYTDMTEKGSHTKKTVLTENVENESDSAVRRRKKTRLSKSIFNTIRTSESSKMTFSQPITA